MKEKSKKTVNNSKEDLHSALVKKALGYDYKEVVEEYVSGEEGEVRLAKKKVTKKNVPPDYRHKIIVRKSTKCFKHDRRAVGVRKGATVKFT